MAIIVIYNLLTGDHALLVHNCWERVRSSGPDADARANPAALGALIIRIKSPITGSAPRSVCACAAGAPLSPGSVASQALAAGPVWMCVPAACRRGSTQEKKKVGGFHR